ncbi:MAG: hypothetical protein BAJALOKI1v1_300013 [Promethearchaeota archaeon]|nr:MAG: hypothetical protein BAJALOKI1v1_300013 [Candidatus Lokiarchaeota archaeon]
MKMIIQETLKKIQHFFQTQEISTLKISTVVVGLGYTGVELSDSLQESSLGVAYTLPKVINNRECSKIHFPGKLTERSLSELLNWAEKPPSLQRVIGIATMNAVSQYILKSHNPYKTINQNLVEYLQISPNSKIINIGLIKPLIRQLSQKTKNITIIEKDLPFGKNFKNFDTRRTIDELQEDELKCDILLSTGTALINDTLEPILKRFRSHAKFIAMIGPTASMLPDILFNSGVNLVGGMTFLSTQETLKVIQEAGGTKFFKVYAHKYNFINKERRYY